MDPSRSQRDAGNPPAAIAGAHRGVGVGGLVGAVERPEAEVDDAAGLRVPVVAEAGDVAGEPVGRGGAEPHSR